MCTCSRRLGRSVVTTVRTGILLRTTTVGVTSVRTLVTIVPIAVVLTGGSIARTLTVSCSLATVGTGHLLRPVVTGRLIATDLHIVARTLVSIGLTLIAIGRRRFCRSTVVLDTSIRTGCLRAPGSVIQTLLVTGVDGR